MIRRFLFCPGTPCPDPGVGGGPLGEFGLGGVTPTCYVHRDPFDASPGVVHGAAVCAPGSVGIVGGVIERSEEGTRPAAAADGTPIGAPLPPPWAPPPGWAPPPTVWPPGAPGSPVPPAPPSAADSSAAEVAAGPADHGPDVPLSRQLAAGGAPSTRGSAWGWVLFAALGLLA